ncbi:sugar phosphate isomerase/epimerase family protein [Rhodopila globiformis]|nr:sugar phosphate isomerase/epimerase [Rhodopila globiformis]
MNPRIAISNIAWPEADDAEALDLVCAAGFGGIEVAPVKTFGPWQTIDLDRVRQVAAGLAARGLPIVAMQGIAFGAPTAKLFGGPEARASLAQHLALVARIAGACGGVPCVFGAPAARDPGDLPVADAMVKAAAFLTAIGPVFAREGASLAIEAVPAAHGGRFITHTAEAIALVRRVRTEGIGLQIDMATMMVNEEDPALLAEAVPLAVHCHASAPQLAPVAACAAAHSRLAGSLRAAGWIGRISVEMRTAPDWRTAIREAGAAMRDVWM